MPIRPRLLTLLATACLLGPGSLQVLRAAEDPVPTERYGLRYELRPDPATGTVAVRLELDQDTDLLREMRFSARRLSDLEGDGELRQEGQVYTWKPPATGGALSWQADVRHKRNDSGYDAWLDEDWGLFRAEDVIPPASTRARRGAASNTVLRFELPRQWSAVTEYREFDGEFPVTGAERRFAQPTGWMVIGPLGVRREQIAGTRVAVAAPIGEDVRRMDMLALLNWNLPELARILPQPLPRLTIVSAGHHMWRGGLSAPQSLYLHADRPLLSENGTSTLLHEVMHVATGFSAEPGYDWIVEGFAEFYSLEMLRRSGTITLPRFRSALKDLEDWGKTAEQLCDSASSGAETALAVGVMYDLQQEVHRKSGGEHDLDDVLRRLLKADRKVTLADLRKVVDKLIGGQSATLQDERLPGCSQLS